MRVGTTIVPHRLVFAIALLGSFGARAHADPLYQLTDLGPLPSAASRMAVNESPGFIVDRGGSQPLRIDNSGAITTDRLDSLIEDPAVLGAIQAPTAPVLYAGLYPSVGGSHYRPGFVVTRGAKEPWQAMVWNGRSGKALGPYPSSTAWSELGLPGRRDDPWFSMASGVNDLGHAVGMVGTGTTTSAAYTWGLTADGSDPLAAIRPRLGSYSKAIGINGHDQVVGVFNTFDDPRAFLFRGTDLIDLNLAVHDSKGLRLLAATGINDEGQIVGFASDSEGDAHQYLLTPIPVPEPSTLALFGLAAGFLVLGSRRRLKLTATRASTGAGGRTQLPSS